MGQPLVQGKTEMEASCHGFRVSTAGGVDGRLAVGCLTAADRAT